MAYGLTSIPLAMAALPIYVHVPKFYADAMGLNLMAIGGLLLAARIFDALQDPLLGYWSDCTRDKPVGRFVWVGIGAPLLAMSMLGLFNPPHIHADLAAWWLIAMLLLVYTWGWLGFFWRPPCPKFCQKNAACARVMPCIVLFLFRWCWC